MRAKDKAEGKAGCRHVAWDEWVCPSVDGRIYKYKYKPQVLNPQPSTPNPKPQTPNPKPSNPNPKPQTLNPKPQTLDPRP